MAYLGNSYQTQSTVPTIDYFSGNGSTTSFTLSKTPSTNFVVEVVVNNVRQNPSTAYSISGNVITFTGAPSAGTNNIYVYYNPVVSIVGTTLPGSVAPSSFSVPNVVNWDGAGNVTIAGNATFNGRVIANDCFYENPTTISANYTVQAGYNAMSAGPITVADGVTITVADGATWTVV